MPKYILRDLICRKCGSLSVDQMVPGLTLPVLHPCQVCKVDTEHDDTGENPGGKNKRYRFADFSSGRRDFRENVRVHSPMATIGETDEPSVDRSGEAIHDRPQFKEDARQERREQTYFETDKKRGHTPLHFDQKSSDKNSQKGDE